MFLGSHPCQQGHVCLVILKEVACIWREKSVIHAHFRDKISSESISVRGSQKEAQEEVSSDNFPGEKLRLIAKHVLAKEGIPDS